MAKDEVLTETDDDIDVIEVDALPGEESKAAEAAKKDEEPPAEEPDADDDDEDEHQEDARLADKDADPEDSEEEAKRKRKLGQRQRQKAAKLRAENELAQLRREIAELRQGHNEIRQTNLSVSEGMVTSRLEEVRRDIATAEAILADAVKNADGESYTTALRLRDEAKAQEAELVNTQKGFVEAKKAPSADSTAQSQLAGAWKAANPWYGTDAQATNVTNAIDAALMAEGSYNPGSPDYYRELTRRVTAQFKRSEGTVERRETRETRDDGRRKGPQIGDRGGGSNGNGSGKRVVHLSKDRVDAIKAAGEWDDPVERAKHIKAYEAYDREQSAGR